MRDETGLDVKRVSNPDTSWCTGDVALRYMPSSSSMAPRAFISWKRAKDAPGMLIAVHIALQVALRPG